MLDKVSKGVGFAIEARDKAVVEKTPDDISVGDMWFASICRQLFPAKAGTALHYLTGVDERSCQRYAAGKPQPPGYFIRELLRSEQGATWLAALMDGSDAQWWRDMQRAQRIAEQIDKLDLG